MTLKTVRLELERAPDDSPYCGYEFTAPLDNSGKIDAQQWLRHQDKCTVRRFWNETIDEHGWLHHQRAGRWVFAWPGKRAGEEPTLRVGTAIFPGERVLVTERDGVERPFRVVDVRAA
jgi:hypothetical protein